VFHFVPFVCFDADGGYGCEWHVDSHGLFGYVYGIDYVLHLCARFDGVCVVFGCDFDVVCGHSKVACFETFGDSFRVVKVASCHESYGWEVGYVCTQHFFCAYVLEVSLDCVSSGLFRLACLEQGVVGSLYLVFSDKEWILYSVVDPYDDSCVWFDGHARVDVSCCGFVVG